MTCVCLGRVWKIDVCGVASVVRVMDPYYKVRLDNYKLSNLPSIFDFSLEFGTASLGFALAPTESDYLYCRGFVTPRVHIPFHLFLLGNQRHLILSHILSSPLTKAEPPIIAETKIGCL